MDDELAFLILRFGIRSTIHVPITIAGSPFAVIVFATAGTRGYDEHDLVFAEELARRASTAMHNAELFQTASCAEAYPAGAGARFRWPHRAVRPR